MILFKISQVKFLLITICFTPAFAQQDNNIRVSPRDPRYLEYSDGRPFIPIGLNLIGVGNMETAKGLAQMEEWMENLARNNGNFMRLWLGNDFWDVEHRKSGEYDSVKGSERLDKIIARATELEIKVKVTLEHFRNFNDAGWDAKPLHDTRNGGTASGIEDFFRGTASRDRFKKKLDWYAARYGADPTIFIWELWNEINAVSRSGYALEDASEQFDWTVDMLDALQKRFPNRLITQSLGSFDDPRVRQTYQAFSTLSKNSLAQVHRYLDLGAEMDVCHEAVDVLAADAVRELLAFDLRKPVLLAESGAVEPKHTGPSKFYKTDKAGIILHDVLFAPFFAGAAGPGQIWHWKDYVAGNNLWFHFSRFAKAIKHVDVPGEQFVVVEEVQKRMRVYGLLGNHTSLFWCRDSDNTWKSELQEGKPPLPKKNHYVDLKDYNIAHGEVEAEIYDPWSDQWSYTRIKKGKIRLPEFKRSIVVKIIHNHTGIHR